MSALVDAINRVRTEIMNLKLVWTFNGAYPLVAKEYSDGKWRMEATVYVNTIAKLDREIDAADAEALLDAGSCECGRSQENLSALRRLKNARVNRLDFTMYVEPVPDGTRAELEQRLAELSKEMWAVREGQMLGLKNGPEEAAEIARPVTFGVVG